ncbi:family 43 glycosylhydrolase [Echinicola sediminis]
MKFNQYLKIIGLACLLYSSSIGLLWAQQMMFADSSRLGRPFSKDPHVVKFEGRYLMYFSIPPVPGKPGGWGIGIAASQDLIQWEKVGEIAPKEAYEKNGFCAPGALVKEGKVHLFYQTYGNGAKDALCHAYSDDGIHFTRNSTNPIFAPEANDWSNGRAIDAEVYPFKGSYFLYFATRDPSGQIQMQGVAKAPGNTDFKREDWTLAKDASILKPELDWEGKCVEGASIIEKNGKLYMFYAGSYNNAPQQIGVAHSEDGVNWTRLFDQPFLANGKEGEWNSSESGHPHIFEDKDSGKTFLFYQGNDDHGKTWWLSNVEVKWRKGKPQLKK